MPDPFLPSGGGASAPRTVMPGDLCTGHPQHTLRFATHYRGDRSVCEQCAYDYDFARAVGCAA